MVQKKSGKKCFEDDIECTELVLRIIMDKPIYHINRYIEETGEVFGDSSHILYVNGAYRDETPLGLLMKDFSCMNASDMHYKKLADRVRYFKEDEEGVKAMSGIVAELIDEEKKESALRMLRGENFLMWKFQNI